jgi:hypothetical protein
MKNRVKKKSGVYAYLSSIQVLETGTELEIARARKEYWKEYKANWRKQQRTETMAFTIICTKAEGKEISEWARKHKRSPSQFIKEACVFGYMRKQYIVPDVYAANEIRQLLAVNYNTLKRLFDGSLLPWEVGKQVMSRMEELERAVLAAISQPKELKNGSM